MKPQIRHHSSTSASIGSHRLVLLTVIMIPDKYSNPPQAPLTFTATVESILEDSRILCANTKAFLDKIVAEITPEEAIFENVLRPFAQAESERQLISNVLGLYLKGNSFPMFWAYF